MNDMKTAKFAIGQVVRHRLFPFRGIIFDVDPQFNNTEEWYRGDPQGSAPAQGSALLPPARRELRDRIHRVCVRAEPARGRIGRAGQASAAARAVRPHARRAILAEGAGAALGPVDIQVRPACDWLRQKSGASGPAFCLRLLPGSVRRGGAVGLGLVLLFLELLGEVLVVLRDELLQLLLAVLDVGLLQRRAVESAGEAVQRNLYRVRPGSASSPKSASARCPS